MEGIKGRVSGISLNKAFLFSAGFGGALIVLVPLLNVDSRVSLILTIGVMILYWLKYYLSEQESGFTDTFADSIYYLGFIFTLVALISAMLSFSVSGSELTSTQVLGEFGIAMVTTLLGLAIRVYYKLFKAFKSDDQENLKDKVHESLSLLCTQINGMNDEVTKTKDILNQSNLSIIKTSAESTKILNDNIKKAQQTAQENITGFFESIEKIIGVATENVDKNSKLVVDHISLFTSKQETALEKHSENLVTTFRDNFEGIFESIKPLPSALSRFNTGLNKATARVDTISARVSDVHSNFDSSTSALTVYLAEITNKYQLVAEKTSDIDSQFKQVINSASSSMAELVSSYKLACSTLSQLYQSTGPDSIVSRASTLNNSLSSSITAIEELTHNLAANSNKLSLCTDDWTDNLIKVNDKLTNHLSIAPEREVTEI